MGYWRIDCIIVTLIFLGLSMIALGLFFGPQIEQVLILLYASLGFLLIGIAIVLAWHPEDFN
ncbi:MAG: hypothetical protein ACFFE6_01600 [Candidatus Thorarchaeota archaeon]